MYLLLFNTLSFRPSLSKLSVNALELNDTVPEHSLYWDFPRSHGSRPTVRRQCLKLQLSAATEFSIWAIHFRWHLGLVIVQPFHWICIVLLHVVFLFLHPIYGALSSWNTQSCSGKCWDVTHAIATHSVTSEFDVCRYFLFLACLLVETRVQ